MLISTHQAPCQELDRHGDLGRLRKVWSGMRYRLAEALVVQLVHDDRRQLLLAAGTELEAMGRHTDPLTFAARDLLWVNDGEHAGSCVDVDRGTDAPPDPAGMPVDTPLADRAGPDAPDVARAVRATRPATQTDARRGI